TVRNSDFFAVLAANILVRLLTTFPVPVDWRPEDFDLETIFPTEDFERLAGIWVDTVRWLSSEGYIRKKTECSQTDKPHFLGVVLTEKGFRSLNLPSRFDSKVKIGERLVQTIDDVQTDRGRKTIEDQIAQIFGNLNT